MVRGLDYYTRTTFEITCRHLGAQKALAAGGRYDRLVEDFGGPPTPAIGFAIGMERITSLLKESTGQEIPSPAVFIAVLGESAGGEGLVIDRGRLPGEAGRDALVHGGARHLDGDGRRLAAGRQPFAPDQNHFHHKLMRLGLFHTEAVVAIYGITAILTGAAFVLGFHSEWLIIAIYAGFCGLVIGFFTLAERRELRFHRTGFFDTGIKARLKVIKDKSLLIRACFLPLQYGLPLLFAAAVLVRDAVPGYLAAVAAGFAAAILMVRVLRWQWVNPVLRVVFYLTVPMVLSLGRIEPAEWVTKALLTVYDYAYGALALFTVKAKRLI